MVGPPDPATLALAAVLLPVLGGALAALGPGRRAGAWAAMAGVALGLLAALSGAAVAAARGAHSRAFADWLQVGERSVRLSLTLDAPGGAALLAVAATGTVALLFGLGGRRPLAPRQAALVATITAALSLAVTASSGALALAGWSLAGAGTYPLLAADAGPGRRAHRLAGAAQWMAAALLLSAVALAAAGAGDGLPWLADPAAKATGPAAGSAALHRPVLALIAAAALVQAGAVPFHAWLVATCAAPATVAAVLHGAAAASGLYLVVRNRVLFELAPELGTALVVAGLVLSLLAAIASLASRTLTRALACATAAHGGLALPLAAVAPVAAAGQVACWSLARCGLYLAAGLAIRALTTGSALSGMGGLRHRLKLATWCFVASAVLLAGVPPFSGFWAAAALLAGLGQAHGAGAVALAAGSLALAAAALLRLALGAFLGSPRVTALGGNAEVPAGGAPTAGLVLAPLLAAALPVTAAVIGSGPGLPAVGRLAGLPAGTGLPALAAAAFLPVLSFLVAWLLVRRWRSSAVAGAAGSGTRPGPPPSPRAADELWGAAAGWVRLVGRSLWTLGDTLLVEVVVTGGLAAMVRGAGLAVARLGDGRRSTGVAAMLAAAAAVLVAAAVATGAWWEAL